MNFLFAKGTIAPNFIVEETNNTTSGGNLERKRKSKQTKRKEVFHLQQCFW
jgi:hypothetical protein